MTKLILISQYQRLQRRLMAEQVLVLINRWPHLALLREKGWFVAQHTNFQQGKGQTDLESHAM